MPVSLTQETSLRGFEDVQCRVAIGTSRIRSSTPSHPFGFSVKTTAEPAVVIFVTIYILLYCTILKVKGE